MLKCTKYYFGWGSAPYTAGGDYMYSAHPEPLAGIGPTSNFLRVYGREGRENEGRGLRKEREGKGGEEM